MHKLHPASWQKTAAHTTPSLRCLQKRLRDAVLELHGLLAAL
jgi:hypothetical protein